MRLAISSPLVRRAPVESAAVGIHAPAEGIVNTAPIENGAVDLFTRVIGWCRDPDLPAGVVWPPPFPPPTGPDVDGVGWCVRHFGLSRETYEEVVRVADELLDDLDFQQRIGSSPKD